MSRSNFTTLLIFFLSYHLVWTKSSSSSSSCKNGNVCINGDCIDNDETTNDSHCKCRPCWRGSHCDQFDDQHEPYFSEKIINLYLKSETIHHYKPIYRAHAHDNDIHNSDCIGLNIENCTCAQIRYEIVEQDERKIFHINSTTGEIFINKPKLIDNQQEQHYKLMIIAINPNWNDKTIGNYMDKNFYSTRTLTIFVNIQNQLDRIKRAAESDDSSGDEDELNGLKFGLRTLAGESNSLQVGSSIHYMLLIGLPKGSSDLVLEIKTSDQSNSRTSLSLYNFSMPFETTDIQFNIPEAKFFLSNKTANVYDRLTLDFGSIKNNGPERNEMIVCFSVILFRKPRRAKKKHSVIVGVEHSKGNMIYVAESEITTVSVSSKDDQIFCDVDMVEEPVKIPLDSAAIFRFNANFQFRSDPVRIELNKTSYEYEPDNRISLGLITVAKFGPNYVAMPSSPHHYKGYRNLSASSQSYTFSTLNMNSITNNGEKSRLFLRNPNNIISFSFPVYALNFEENIGRNMSFQLDVFVGKRSYYTRLINITIIGRNSNERLQSFIIGSEANFTQTDLSKGSLTQLKIRSKFRDFKDENVFTDYAITIDGMATPQLPFIPCSARLINEEMGINIPYINPARLKPEKIEKNKFVFRFGRINFIRLVNPFLLEDNDMVAEITFRLPFDSSVKSGEYSIKPEQIQVTSGYETKPVIISNSQLKISSSEDVANNETSSSSSPSTSSSSIIELSTNSSVKWSDLIVGGGAAVDIELELEPNAAFEDFRIAINSDMATAVDSLPDLKICRFAVIRVAETMPCTCVERDTINEKQIVYGYSNQKMTKEKNKTNIRPYDRAAIDFGSISVVSGSKIKQKILTNFVIMIPDSGTNNGNSEQQQLQSPKQYPIRVDIISNSASDNQDNIIKSEQINLNISELLPEPIAADMSVDLEAELFNETDSFILPGFTTNILIRTLTRPNTMGPLRIEIDGDENDPNSAISVCGLWIHRIGYNLPCVEPNQKAEYAYETFGLNKRAILQLDMITNFGNHHRKSERDEHNDNSIEFMAMIRMLDQAENSNQTIRIKVVYGHKDITVTKHLIVPVGQKPNANDDHSLEISRRKSSEPRKVTLKPYGNNKLVHHARPKLFFFDIELERNHQTKLTIAMDRSNSYKMCNAAFIKVGRNYPCYSPLSLNVQHNQFELGMICHTDLKYQQQQNQNNSVGNDDENNDNLLRLAFAIRPTESFPDSLPFIVSGTVLYGYQQRPMETKNELTLTVVPNKAKSNSISKISDHFPINEGARVVPAKWNNHPEGIGFKIRQRKWITFRIRIPLYSTGKLSATIRGQTDENRAYIVLYDLRLISGGANIPCPLDNAPKIHLNSTVNSNQTNLINADLGWFANFGYTHYIDINNNNNNNNNNSNSEKDVDQNQNTDSNNNNNNNDIINMTNSVANDNDQEHDNADDDDDDDADVLTIEVLAELTDHPSLTENDVYRLEFEAHYSNLTDTITTRTEAKIRLLSEGDGPNPKLDVNIRYKKRMPVLDRNETFTVMATIRHLPDSNAEPSNPVLRIFTPDFVEISNINWANTKRLPKLKRLADGSTDILFPWILFNEQFTVNLTIQIDPRNIRGYGREEVSIITPYRMLCQHFRLSSDTKFPCSEMKHMNYRTHSTECNKPLGMSDGHIHDDQITASSAISQRFAPKFSRPNLSSSFWSPAWRNWRHGHHNQANEQHYIQIDFRQKTRLVRIEFKSIKNQRNIHMYHLEYSFDGKVWYLGSNSTKIIYNIVGNDENIKAIGESWLEKPIEARLIRLIIDSVSTITTKPTKTATMKMKQKIDFKDNVHNQYLAVKFELYGCYLKELESSTRPASNESLKFQTHYTDDTSKKNRLISIDPYTNVIYFCDATSNIDNFMCYFSDSGGNSWQIVGRSIDSFEGFELASGKFFAIDYERPAYFWSSDGVTWIPIDYQNFNKTVEHPKFQRKMIIPRFAFDDLNKMNVRIGNWRANYQGLNYEDNQYPKALWNKCCGLE